MTAVAIDGPAGAGKSTVARAVADALGWRYVDTGAMYRALALAALQRGIHPDDEAGLKTLLSELDIHSEGDAITVDGEDVSESIRTEAVNEIVPVVASHPGVRAAFVDKQRREAASDRVVMEGRDIGTVVLPDALLKVYLTASPEERAARRAAQAGLPNAPGSVERTLAAIRSRDRADSTRTESPLARADDAIEVDSTNSSVEEVVGRIVDAVRERLEGNR